MVNHSRSLQIGKTFLQIGETFLQIGETFLQIGETFLQIGETFLQSRNLAVEYVVLVDHKRARSGVVWQPVRQLVPDPLARIEEFGREDRPDERDICRSKHVLKFTPGGK
jgi:hypothetical protein